MEPLIIHIEFITLLVKLILVIKQQLVNQLIKFTKLVILIKLIMVAKLIERQFKFNLVTNS